MSTPRVSGEASPGAGGVGQDLRARAIVGDGSVLLAMDLDRELADGLAGFSIRRTNPAGDSMVLPNRLSFDTPITSATTPEQRVWTPSDQAPFQKFRWIDFPRGPGSFTYEVTALYFADGGGLRTGPSAEVTTDVNPHRQGHFEMGFTRGYLSSQAYASRFHNAPIRPPGDNTVTFDTALFEQRYEWLGHHARTMLFGFLGECVTDPNVTVDAFAYDLDEPDFVKGLQALGGRLSIILDDASLHTGTAREVQSKAILQASAGAANVVTGHFRRFSHDKVLILKRNGSPVKVLTGSANFSVRGLYVQANNVLVFDDPGVAQLYEQTFQAAFADMAGFADSPMAQRWFDIAGVGLPPGAVSFAPHPVAGVSLDRVAAAIEGANSSVLFAVMQLTGTGTVMDDLRDLGNRQEVFGYGLAQSATGLELYKPGATNGVFTSFAFLKDKVPEPFRAEWAGGPGQVIHHKFVVVDFNGDAPTLFTGSSNLAAGGEAENGDNLLAITDPGVVLAYAVEAIRLVDHYHFRVAMQGATDASPLALQGPGASPAWWESYYDQDNVKFRERTLFSK